MTGDTVQVDRSVLLQLLSRVESILKEVRDLKQALGKKA
jgi:hypothetical protein